MHQRAHIRRTDEREREREREKVCISSHPCSKRKRKEQLGLLSVASPVIYRCPRRNVPDFGRVFLMLKYTDITQNTYVQS